MERGKKDTGTIEIEGMEMILKRTHIIVQQDDQLSECLVAVPETFMANYLVHTLFSNTQSILKIKNNTQVVIHDGDSIHFQNFYYPQNKFISLDTNNTNNRKTHGDPLWYNAS